jgi:O-antigen ligase
MRFLVPLVAALVPLLITPGLLSYFDVTPKIAILLFGLSLILLYPSANVSNVRNLLRAPAGRWLAGLIGSTWIVSALATVFSTYPLLSLDGGNWRRYGFIVESGLLIFTLLSAAWLAADQNNVRVLLRACVASAGLAALYGIAQYFGWDPWLPAAAYQAGEGPFTIVRPPGTLGHADYFAAWLVIVAFFGLALARMEQARWLRLAALGVSILSITAIVLSGTRSAILGLLAGALVLTSLNRPRIRLRAVMIGVVVAACSVIFWFTPAGTKLRARAHWSSEDAWGGARLLLWRDSLGMARYHPLMGFGPETFATEFPRFESADLARAYPDFYHESPHNIFLDALTTRGAGGLLSLLGFCGLAFWAITRRKRPELATALVASLVCQQFTVFVVPTALYFYLLIALLVTEPSDKAPDKSSARWLLPLAVAASLASLMFAAFAVRLVVANRALAVVFQRIESSDASGAAKEYQLVLRWEPQGTGADLNYSRAMAELAARTPVLATRVQATQQATEAAIRATRTAEDRYNAWYNLAKLLAGQNNLAGVEQSLRNAIAWAPNWFKPHWVLAQLLEASHRHQQAVAEAEVAFDLDGGRDPEVSETWRKLQQSSDPQPKTGSQP